MPTGQVRQQAHSEACRRRIECLLKGDSAGALDLTNCDFSDRRARDEMRHITWTETEDVRRTRATSNFFAN